MAIVGKLNPMMNWIADSVLFMAYLSACLLQRRFSSAPL
jgi:hypothetical protein